MPKYGGQIKDLFMIIIYMDDKIAAKNLVVNIFFTFTTPQK